MANSPHLSAKKPLVGKTKLIHNVSVKVVMIVSAFLLEINLPCINLVKLSPIQRTYLLPNFFRSRVMISLNNDDLGSVALGQVIDF